MTLRKRYLSVKFFQKCLFETVFNKYFAKCVFSRNIIFGEINTSIILGHVQWAIQIMDTARGYGHGIRIGYENIKR